MDTKKYILAIDHGTSGFKTAIVSVFGEVMDFVFEPTPLYLLPNGGAEQKPEEWWAALVKATRQLIAKNTVPVEDIVGIGVSSQWSGTVPVDKEGKNIGNAIIWLDSRGESYINKAVAGLINISGYGITNLLRWLPIMGGGPTHAGKDPIAHILWLQHEKPEMYNATYKFLECKDYINLCLTGKFAATFDSITMHWLTDNRDINNVKYDDKILNHFKLNRSQYPDLIKSTDILGTLTKKAAEELGLSENVKVAACSPDLHSAAVGSGAVLDYEGHIYIGTSSWVICHVPFKKVDIFHNIASLPSAIPGRYFVADEQESAGACLSWIRDKLVYHKNIIQPKDSPPADFYKKLDEIVDTVPAGSNNLIFTPWLWGERTPIEDHNVRGGLHNISLNTTIDQIFRAIFEGVAYNSRWVLTYVEKLARHRIDSLNMIGGGALSDVWCQIYADVLNRTIRQVKDPIQANARGATFIASVALGYITFEDIPKYMQYTKTFTPNPANRKLYDLLYGEFLGIYKSTHKMYNRLAQIDSKLKKK